jgi:hypothetical protein
MNWRAIARAALLAAAGLACAPAVAAHETTRSYVSLEREGERVEARLRVAFRDIEVVAWMDDDLDGRITWGEARRRLGAVDAYVRSALSLDAGGACVLTPGGAGASTDGGIGYLELGYRAQCPSGQAPLTVRSRLFAEVDAEHRTFLRASVGAASVSTVLSAAEPSVELEDGGAAAAFRDFFAAGVEHLLAGPDHLVFLLALMLPAVCSPGALRKAALGVLAAVTGFTIAHALTLSAATTELLRPPTGAVEALIALSIVVTAADNLRPFIPAPRAAVAALFGTVHGFGFAGALGALELTGGGLATALVGFNLGIEAAQVAVVLAAVPVLVLLGRGKALLWAGSAAAGAVGAWWLWLRLVPFGLAG